MTLLRKSIPQFLMAMFTVMGVLLGTAASHVVVIPSSAFAQTSSLAQDIVNLAQQEETDQSSSYEG
jgi:predicted PurR-regulated permease PerM